MTLHTPSLKRAVLAGSSWTLLSVVAGHSIKLIKTLVLTRLLFPEAYGVMAIVGSVLFALGMLSDAGLAAAAIRHVRAGESSFINTLWTAKVIRGVLIFVITCLIAYPLSIIYRMPDLVWLIPIAGFTMVLSGLNSTNVYSQQREMKYGRLTALDLGNEIVGLVVMMVWAFYHPGVGAMIGTTVVCSVSYLVASHYLLPGPRNHFAWDSEALKDIFHFGKWVLLSSVIFLIYMQGDRMLLGHYLDAGMLGIYSIAILMSEMVSGVIAKLNNSVLYPAISRVINQDRVRLREVFYKSRLGFDAVVVVPVGVLMVVGSEVIAYMYDQRYHAAGWMLQILCVRLAMIAMLSTSETCLFALGKPKFSVVQNIGRATWILTGIPLAWSSFGVVGVLWVVSTTEIPVLVVIWYGMAKEKLLTPWGEARSVFALVAGISAGLLIQRLFL